MRVRAILNPRAGVAAHRMREAVGRGRPAWTDYAVLETREAGHATQLAREAAAGGAEIVLAVGGDGTVNEVARGLIGSRAALGIVPAGSGNGLARALRLPARPEQALAVLETGTRRAMDVGLLNGRLFLNVAGVGFDAAVGHAFHERGKRGGRRGLLGYVSLSLHALLSYRPTPIELEVDGVRSTLEPFVLTFANGPQYGSGAVINPGGRLDDGQLEIVTFAALSIPRLLLASVRLFNGGIERAAGYSRRPATAAVVTAGAPIAVHVDGDPGTPVARIEVELRPRALEVVVPAATAADPEGPFSV